MSPNGLTATTTCRSWAGFGSSPRRIDVADHDVGRGDEAGVLGGAGFGDDRALALGEERPPQRGLRTLVARGERGQVTERVPIRRLDDDDVGAERGPHPGGVGAGQAGRLDDPNAGPGPAPSRALRGAETEGGGVVDVGAPQRQVPSGDVVGRAAMEEAGDLLLG